jgi:hypothetical protein
VRVANGIAVCHYVPACSHRAIETMHTDACQHIYDCKQCGHRMKAIKGRCVYRSYGSVQCPPVQSGDGCCQ